MFKDWLFINDINTKFILACHIMNSKGYKISVNKNDQQYEKYDKSKCMFIMFEGYEKSLPNVPEGFVLDHNIEDSCSILISKYPEGLNTEQTISLMDNLTDALFSWVEEIPDRRADLG